MSAIFVIAGHGGSREYAKMEMLADQLKQDLADFRVTKVLKNPADWDDWLALINKTHGWSHNDNHIVYRLLGEGNPSGALLGESPTLSPYPRLIGDGQAFAEMAKDYYHVTAEIKEQEVDLTVQGNLEICTAGPPPPMCLSDPGAPMTICVHNATSAIAYQLLWRLASGAVLGADRPLHLRLLAAKDKAEKLEGVVMELEDCILPAIKSVSASVDVADAVAGSDLVIISAGEIGGEVPETLPTEVIQEMVFLGTALETVKNAKALVIGNGCTAAAAVIAAAAPSVAKENITALTRIPQYRAQACIAAHLSDKVNSAEMKINGNAVHNVIIWGGDANDVTPDISSAVIVGAGSVSGMESANKATAVIRNPDFWSEGKGGRDLWGALKPDALVGWVRERDQLHQKKREGHQPAMLVARAAAEHITNWYSNTESKYFENVGVYSDGGSYKVPAGFWFSYPCKFSKGEVQIASGLAVSKEADAIICNSVKQLKARTDDALKKAGFAETAPLPEGYGVPPPVEAPKEGEGADGAAAES